MAGSVAGGEGINGNRWLSSVEVYNAATKKCEMAPSMATGRFNLNMVVMEDELYAVGGDEYGNASIEKLSKVSGAWQVVAI